LGGRVKTLHPRIHGGILARRDLAEFRNPQIRPIDLVVVNLYPFEQTIAKPGITLAELSRLISEVQLCSGQLPRTTRI